MNEPSAIGFPTDFCGEARLFPLSNVVAFPHSVLPLHIFESRYQEMMGDAIADDRLLAMATLLPGFEIDYYSRPAVDPVICIGRIMEYQQNDNGTYDFLLGGLQRAEIQHEITPVRSYRRAAVELRQDEAETDAAAAQQLTQQLATRLARQVPQLRVLLEVVAQRNLPLGTFTDIAAHHLDLDLSSKLSLLRELNPSARARLLLQYLSGQE